MAPIFKWLIKQTSLRMLAQLLVDFLQEIGLWKFLVAILVSTYCAVNAVVEGLPVSIGFVLMIGAFAIILMILYYSLALYERYSAGPLKRLAILRQQGVQARNHFGSMRLVTHDARKRIEELSNQIYAEASKVSISEAELLKTLNTFDYKNHPQGVWDKPEILHFSELLKRVDDFIKRHQK